MKKKKDEGRWWDGDGKDGGDAGLADGKNLEVR